MIILGIADNHDSGAALVIDGRLVGAVNQERIDRKKNSGAFPWGAIDQLLKDHQVAYRDIHRICVGTAFTPSALLRQYPSSHTTAKKSGQFSILLHGYMLYQSMLRRSGLHIYEIEACKKVLKARLKERPFETTDIKLWDHHQAHAEAAYRTQPRAEILVLTLDAMGDGLSATAWHGRSGDIRKLWDQSGLASINLFYSRITEILGFTPLRHEGKVTGLAAYAPPPEELIRHFEKEIAFKDGKFKRFSYKIPAAKNDAFWRVCQDYSKEIIAAAAQTVLEKAVLDFVQYWIEQTGLRDIAVAGGIFANVKLNQRIANLPDLNSLWVLPHMGDGGLAVGAALASADAPPLQLQNAYLGFTPSRDDNFRALKRNKLPRQNTKVMERAVNCLANGGVIARCSGGLEWGPRALGNRSIFAVPSDPGLNDTLNQRLQRTEFMPFAPIVRDCDADKYFLGLEKISEAARFMTVCVDCTAEFKQKAPAAVHVDGTARPQILREQDNPEVYELLGRVGVKTGIPILLNTSFNIHEEPIVCTADDAVRAFLSSGLEGLWLGEFFVEK